MKTISLDYTTLINIVAAKNLSLQYTEYANKYELFAAEGDISWESTILRSTEGVIGANTAETANCLNFETNYKSNANAPAVISTICGLRKVKHVNGTATTEPTTITFPGLSSDLIIDNLGTENMLVSFDGGENFKTVTPTSSISIEVRLTSLIIKAAESSCPYEILVVY